MDVRIEDVGSILNSLLAFLSDGLSQLILSFAIIFGGL